MADKKISELDPFSDLAATDTLPIVDVSAGKTVKVPVNEIVKDGGTTGQVFTKVSATDYDTEWSDKFTPAVGVAEWRVASGTDGPSMNAGILNPLLYDTITYNNIAGFSIPVDGTFKLPVGAFLITATVSPYYTRRTRLYIRRISDSAIIGNGTCTYANAAAGDTSVVGVITVTDPDETYEIVLSCESSNVIGLNDQKTYVAFETVAKLIIQKV